MKISCIAVWSMSLGAVAAQGQARPPRFVLRAEQVTRVVSSLFAARGIEISAGQVALPLEVVASEAEPALQVSGVDALGQLDARHPEQASAGVRLRCRTTAICRPFYVFVTWQGTEDAHRTAVQGVREAGGARRHDAPRILKTGARTTLLMQADHAEIRMAVVCLQNAAQGDRVRVASLDRKHTYTAEVVDAGLVKGRF